MEYQPPVLRVQWRFLKERQKVPCKREDQPVPCSCIPKGLSMVPQRGASTSSTTGIFIPLSLVSNFPRSRKLKSPMVDTNFTAIHSSDNSDNTHQVFSKTELKKRGQEGSRLARGKVGIGKAAAACPEKHRCVQSTLLYEARSQTRIPESKGFTESCICLSFESHWSTKEKNPLEWN